MFPKLFNLFIPPSARLEGTATASTTMALLTMESRCHVKQEICGHNFLGVNCTYWFKTFSTFLRNVFHLTQKRININCSLRLIQAASRLFQPAICCLAMKLLQNWSTLKLVLSRLDYSGLSIYRLFLHYGIPDPATSILHLIQITLRDILQVLINYVSFQDLEREIPNEEFTWFHGRIGVSSIEGCRPASQIKQICVFLSAAVIHVRIEYDLVTGVCAFVYIQLINR